MIITRKIELLIDQSEKEKRNEIWGYLRNLSHDVFQAYNTVVSNQFFNEQFTDRIRKTDEELKEKDEKFTREIKALNEQIRQTKDKEEKAKLKQKRKDVYGKLNMLSREARKKAEEMYGTSEENSTYQLISKMFPNIPSTIRATLNRDAVKAYRSDSFDVKQGNRSIRVYRKGIPIPFDKNAMRFYITEKNTIGMHWLNDISFVLNFGRDRSNNKHIVESVMNGSYQYSNSKISIEERKIFLLLCVDIPSEKRELNEDTAVGVNLGIVVPAYCALNNGPDRLAIGSIDDLFRVRVQMQKRRSRIHKALKMAKGGHGRVDKLKALEHIGQKERNFVRTYNHMISHHIVKFALKNGAKTIKMELLEGYAENDRDSLILRNWSYFELHQMTIYKAKKYGMQVKFTDPYRISQTCNCCGKFDELNLKTRDKFVCQNDQCKNYNVEVFSDYNASLNNAMSEKYVTKKEDCTFHNLEKQQA